MNDTLLYHETFLTKILAEKVVDYHGIGDLKQILRVQTVLIAKVAGTLMVLGALRKDREQSVQGFRCLFSVSQVGNAPLFKYTCKNLWRSALLAKL